MRVVKKKNFSPSQFRSVTMAYLWLLLYADFIRIDIEFDTLSIAIEYEMNWNRFECYPYLRNVITH